MGWVVKERLSRPWRGWEPSSCSVHDVRYLRSPSWVPRYWRPEAEAVEECSLLTYSSWLSCFAFFCTQDHQLRGSSTHSILSPPISTINQENVPHICLQVIWWRHFLSCCFSSQLILACVKLTQTRTFSVRVGGLKKLASAVDELTIKEWRQQAKVALPSPQTSLYLGHHGKGLLAKGKGLPT